jgi:hypothetical protein
MLGKPTASLSSGLLARKGHARPAMRPQGFVSLSPPQHEDLGWNDMGHDQGQDWGDDMHPQLHAVVQPAPAEAQGPVPAPPVLQLRAELEEQIAPRPVIEAPEPEPEPEYEAEAEVAPQPLVQVRAVKPVPAPTPAPIVTTGTLARVAREAVAGKSKAAFTLRLDPDRHLRLRLASAVTNLSAQQLVTQALDAFLESLTEVDTLARQLDPRERKQ